MTPPAGPLTVAERPAQRPRIDLRTLQADRWRIAERRRWRRALLLLGFTLVLPGSAQLVAGNRRVGWWALRIYGALVVAVVIVAVMADPGTIAGWLVRSWVLTLVRLLAVGVALGWVVLLVDAWRLGRPPTLTRRHRQVAVGLTVLLCLATAVPLGYAAHYAQLMRDDIVALFPDGPAADVGRRLNVLLLGGDAAPNRPGLRTDSINLASVDVTTGRPVLFSLPRNFEKARFPAGTPLAERFPDGFRGDVPDDAAYLLNAVYTYGTENPDLLPGAADPGAEAVKQAVSGTLGLPVHYYAMVNLFGFRDLVDALGGVTITVREDVPYTVAGKDATIRAGVRRLTGRQALIYARSRTGSSDYARMGRQRCVLGAILGQADPAHVLRNFQAVAGSAKSMVSTDIPRGTLPDLVDLALKAKDQDVSTLAFVPPLISAGDPDIDLIQRKVQAAIERSESAEEAAEPAAAASRSGRSAAASAPPAAAPAKPAGPTASPAAEPQDLGAVC